MESQIDDANMPSTSFFKGWFLFVALLAISMLLGGAYVIYLLLGHFGVIA